MFVAQMQSEALTLVGSEKRMLMSLLTCHLCLLTHARTFNEETHISPLRDSTTVVCIHYQLWSWGAAMVRTAPRALAQIGRLATPAAESLAGPVDVKVKDFFREVCSVVDEQVPSQLNSAGTMFLFLAVQALLSRPAHL